MLSLGTADAAKRAPETVGMPQTLAVWLSDLARARAVCRPLDRKKGDTEGTGGGRAHHSP